MSRGLPQDLVATQQQLQAPTPSQDNRNWLRHTLGSEAAAIDEMLLTGNFTIEEMAEQIRALSEHNANDIQRLIARVRSHLNHLQESWNGPMEPHHLTLLQDHQGHWSFG